MNYLASPPLCVAYALAGRMDIDITREPLQGDVRLADIWPSQREVSDAIEQAVESDMFRRSYGEVFEGDENWNALEVPAGDRYAWDPGVDVRQAPALLRRHGRRARGGLRRDHRRAARSRCWATASPPTTSRPPARSRATRPPAATCASTASSAATSTPTGRGAATTRS